MGRSVAAIFRTAAEDETDCAYVATRFVEFPSLPERGGENAVMCACQSFMSGSAPGQAGRSCGSAASNIVCQTLVVLVCQIQCALVQDPTRPAHTLYHYYWFLARPLARRSFALWWPDVWPCVWYALPSAARYTISSLSLFSLRSQRAFAPRRCAPTGGGGAVHNHNPPNRQLQDNATQITDYPWSARRLPSEAPRSQALPNIATYPKQLPWRPTGRPNSTPHPPGCATSASSPQCGTSSPTRATHGQTHHPRWMRRPPSRATHPLFRVATPSRQSPPKVRRSPLSRRAVAGRASESSALARPTR